MSGLWEFDSYRCTPETVINHSIIEYDMKSANTSLAREFNLLPEKEIERIEKMGKKDRVVTIGKIKRENKEYSIREKEAFKNARRMFFEANDISDDDVITIKRDAIFLKRYVCNEKCSKYIDFRKKNLYTSYLYLRPFEIFYHPSNGLDIKGISDDVYEMYHKDGMGGIIIGVISALENATNQHYFQAKNFLSKIMDKYKWLELGYEFYREFNAASLFRYKDGQTSAVEYTGDINALDISYNFKLLLQLLLMITLI